MPDGWNSQTGTILKYAELLCGFYVVEDFVDTSVLHQFAEYLISIKQTVQKLQMIVLINA